MPKVSVIIPVYNKERYLSRTIRSVLNQSLEDIEVILINDGSTDDSLKICREFEQIDSRIRVMNQENYGVSVARNKGLSLAKGEFIGFVDADDYIEEDMYLNMYIQCKEFDVEICICNYFTIDKSLNLKSENMLTDNQILFEDEIVEQIVSKMISPISLNGSNQRLLGSACRLLINKDFLNRSSIKFLEDLPLMEDLVFCVDILTSAKKVLIDNSNYYYYTFVENSAGRKYRKNHFELSLNVTKILKEILISKNKYYIVSDDFNYRYYNTAISSIVNVLNPKNNSTFNMKLTLIKNICSNKKIKGALSKIEESNFFLKDRIKLKAIKNEKILIIYLYYTIALKLKS